MDARNLKKMRELQKVAVARYNVDRAQLVRLRRNLDDIDTEVRQLRAVTVDQAPAMLAPLQMRIDQLKSRRVEILQEIDTARAVLTRSFGQREVLTEQVASISGGIEQKIIGSDQ